MITTQIRSRIEYIIPTGPTDNITLLLLHLNLISKSSLIGGFSTRFNDMQKWLTFYWATLYIAIRSEVQLYKQKHIANTYKLQRETLHTSNVKLTSETKMSDCHSVNYTKCTFNKRAWFYARSLTSMHLVDPNAP